MLLCHTVVTAGIATALKKKHSDKQLDDGTPAEPGGGGGGSAFFNSTDSIHNTVLNDEYFLSKSERCFPSVLLCHIAVTAGIATAFEQ